MTKLDRNDLASVFIAICVVSFGVFLWLFFSYFSSHPAGPKPELGITYPLSNHGSYVYLTAVETTGLALLIVLFVVSLLMALAFVPKKFVLDSSKTNRWLSSIGGAAMTALTFPSSRLKVIFVASVSLSLVGISVFGRIISEYLVSKGLVLHFF
jgi:hypothetical protein